MKVKYLRAAIFWGRDPTKQITKKLKMNQVENVSSSLSQAGLASKLLTTFHANCAPRVKPQIYQKHSKLRRTHRHTATGRSCWRQQKVYHQLSPLFWSRSCLGWTGILCLFARLQIEKCSRWAELVRSSGRVRCSCRLLAEWGIPHRSSKNIVWGDSSESLQELKVQTTAVRTIFRLAQHQSLVWGSHHCLCLFCSPVLWTLCLFLCAVTIDEQIN